MSLLGHTATAYGLDSGPDKPRWDRESMCKPTDKIDANWWAPERATRMLPLAAHICFSHCPVLAKCHAAALDDYEGVKGTMRAGVYYPGNKRYGNRPVWYEPKPQGAGCPICHPAVPVALELNEVLTRVRYMRARGMPTGRIAARLGCTPGRIKYLCKQYAIPAVPR